MPTEDALEAMQALASETGLDLSDAALAASQPQAEDPPAAPAVPEPQAAPAAGDKPAAQPQAATPAAAQEDHRVPLATYLEEREKRQASERRIAEFEAKQKAAEPAKDEPDPFLDPVKFADARAEARVQAAVAPIVQQLQMVIANNNLAAARATHGVEVADKAYQEFDKAMPSMSPAERAVVMQAQNPFVAAVQWMKRRDALAEFGDDPTAYEQRIREKLLSDPDFLARATEAARAGAAGETGLAPAAQPQEQPRTPAGQFASPKAPALPSVNRSGSGAGSAPVKVPEVSDLEFVNEVINAKARPAGY